MTKEYRKAENCANRADKLVLSTIKDLKELKGNLECYYNILRWKNLGVSSEEYEVLFDRYVPLIDNSDILEQISCLIDTLESNLK